MDGVKISEHILLSYLKDRLVSDQFIDLLIDWLTYWLIAREWLKVFNWFNLSKKIEWLTNWKIDSLIDC